MRRRLAIALVALVLGACDSERPVHLFVAASTVETAEELAARFERGTGQRVVVNAASTSILARQIGAGAPVDVFLSASVEWMDDVVARGAIDAGSRVDLMGNTLVVIVPAAAGEMPASLEALVTEGGRLALADPAHVPAGLYAKAALTSLGVWPGLTHRILAASDVRAAVTLVARGEAVAGIVYATDALVTEEVRVAFPIPADAHAPIRYQLGHVPNARAAARAFWSFCQSPEAAAVIESHGFRATAVHAR